MTFNNHDLKHIERRFGGAICIPSVCSASDFVPRLMKQIFDGTNLVYSSDYNQDEFCQMKQEFSVNLSGGIGV